MVRKVVQKKEKKPNALFDFLNSISDTKQDLIESGTYAEQAYNPYMINRYLSFSQDTALYAQQMNEMYWIDRKMHYDYLRAAIRKKKRFFSYVKKEKAEEDIKLVAEYYNISQKQAKVYIEALSDEEIVHIRTVLDKGGN